MTIWTAVFRKSQFAAAFTQTGFAGTWEQASEEARRIAADLPDTAQVWVIPSTDTTVELEVSNGRGGTMFRHVKIAPTKEQKAAAAERADKIRALLAADAARPGFDLLRKWGARLVWSGELPEGADLFAMAAAAVDRGMDFRQVCFVLS